MFECDSGECIDIHDQCDGHEHCDDGSDGGVKTCSKKLIRIEYLTPHLLFYIYISRCNHYYSFKYNTVGGILLCFSCCVISSVVFGGVLELVNQKLIVIHIVHIIMTLEKVEEEVIFDVIV